MVVTGGQCTAHCVQDPFDYTEEQPGCWHCKRLRTPAIMPVYMLSCCYFISDDDSID